MKLGASVVFEEKGSDMACSVKSKNKSTKGILNLLELCRIIYTYTLSRELQ